MSGHHGFCMGCQGLSGDNGIASIASSSAIHLDHHHHRSVHQQLQVNVEAKQINANFFVPIFSTKRIGSWTSAPKIVDRYLTKNCAFQEPGQAWWASTFWPEGIQCGVRLCNESLQKIADRTTLWPCCFFFRLWANGAVRKWGRTDLTGF